MVAYISRDDSYALEHYGVKGMKWGVRKERDFDTTFRGGTSTTQAGNKTITANGVTVLGRKGKEHRRAERAARRAEYAYHTSKKNTTIKDGLSVRGNAYTKRYNEEMNKSSSKKANRMAKKDAKEFARAKMYYGEGAGTRRKLIKNTVNQRSKDIPGYKDAFEVHLASQNMADHATKAKRERKASDAKNAAGRGFRGAVNIASGNPQRAAASVLAVYGVARVTGMDKKAVAIGKKYAKKAAGRIYSMKKAYDMFGNPLKGL